MNDRCHEGAYMSLRPSIPFLLPRLSDEYAGPVCRKAKRPKRSIAPALRQGNKELKHRLDLHQEGDGSLC